MNWWLMCSQWYPSSIVPSLLVCRNSSEDTKYDMAADAPVNGRHAAIAIFVDDTVPRPEVAIVPASSLSFAHQSDNGFHQEAEREVRAANKHCWAVQ
jgi:hypothetical protein